MQAVRVPGKSCVLAIALALSGCGSNTDDGQGAPAGAGASVAGTVAQGSGAGGASAGTNGAAGRAGGGAGGSAGSTGGAGSASAGSGSAGMSGGAGASGAGAGGAGAGAGSGGSDGAPTTGPFPPVTHFEMAGPYTPSLMNGVGPNGNYQLHFPQEAPPAGARYPIVGWMSGGGTTPDLYTLLPHLASHGFVVVASNTIPGIGAEAELGQEIIAGIDWAIAENARSGGPLFERVDPTKLASTGYSMGSLATFMIAADARLVTTVHISGGNMAPERVNNLHAPAAFICGVPGDATCNILSPECDIAGANCALDFEGAKTPVFYATFQSGHLGILTPPFTERINAMTAAWLRYKLMGDTTLAAKFIGPDCAYCKDTANWTVKQKNL